VKGGHLLRLWLQRFSKRDVQIESRHDPFQDLRPPTFLSPSIKLINQRKRAWKKLFGGIACPPYRE
jgi:hypothetical protein